MALPKDVEEQAKAADELLRKMQEGETGKTEETVQPPGEEQEAAPEEVKPEGKEAEVAPPKATEEPKAAPEVDLKEYERLKHAHSVLQGKYNAEVPRLYEKIKDLEAKIAEGKSPAPASTEAQPKSLDGVLKKLTDDYGEDFSTGVQALIKEQINSALSGIVKDVENVKSTVVRSKEDRFLEELTSMVPSWRDIFADPTFSDFLDSEDSFSGKTLRELAVEANNALDAKRLAKFYKAFLAKSEEVKPAPKVETKDKREALITPAASGKQNASGTGGEKPDYIKADDIQKFYNDVARGSYNYRQKEKEATEERINRAISNNWVIA